MIPKLLLGPILALISIVVYLVVSPLLVDITTGWYLYSVDACEITSTGHRFDRVVLKDTSYATADAAWANVTASSTSNPSVLVKDTAYVLDSACGFTTALTSNQDVYTSANTDTHLSTGATLAAATVIPGAKVTAASQALTAGQLETVVRLVLQFAALAIPVGIFGLLMYFTRDFFMGMGIENSILLAIAIVVVLILVGTLLGIILPFLDGAYTAINPYRYLAYSSGLGALARIISNFYGVVMIAGIATVAWAGIDLMRKGSSTPLSTRM